MENNKKSAGTIALVVLLLIVTIASLVLATYAWAKYTTTESGNATANVANWNVSFTENNTTFTGSYNHVVDGKIAPGTTGSFQINVVPNNTEVCFNYTLTITSVDFLNNSSETALPDDTVLDGSITLGQLRSHIRFTDDSATPVDVTDGAAITGTYNLTGTTHNNTSSAALDDGVEVITWNWPYSITSENATEVSNYDAIDTAAGKYASANGLRMRVNYSITATQINPNNATH